MSWDVTVHARDGKVTRVRVKSETLATGISEAVSRGELGFYGKDEETGESLALRWDDAVAVKVQPTPPPAGPILV